MERCEVLSRSLAGLIVCVGVFVANQSIASAAFVCTQASVDGVVIISEVMACMDSAYKHLRVDLLS